MKRAPRSRQRHDLYAKYHDYDSEISDLLGECGVKGVRNELRLHPKLAAEDVGKVIARALHRNAEVERSRIHIAVEGSKVILSGAAHTWHEQHMAEQAAWSTTGVTEVENNIEIGA